MRHVRHLFTVAVVVTWVAAMAACNPLDEISLGSSGERAPERERTAFASVSIVPSKERPSVDQVQVSPRDASLSPGQRFLFTAVAVDALGRPVIDADFEWQVKDSSMGTITPSGLFTAGVTPGTYLDAVEVSVGSGLDVVTTSASVHVFRPGEASARLLDSVVVYPSAITVRPGQVVGLGALGWDDQGRLVQDLSYRWGMANSDAGRVDQFGFFTASEAPGSYPNAIQVTATQDTPQSTAEARSFISVTVTDEASRGVLSQLVVVPSTITVTPEQRLGLSARAFDESGQPVRDVTFTWEVRQPEAGKMEEAGYFVAGHQTGQYGDAIQAVATQQTPQGTVQARATIAVTVEPPRVIGDLAVALLVPREVTLAPGQRFIFLATGLDSNGNAVRADVAWEVANPTAGSINSSGVFAAGDEPGTYVDAVLLRLSQEKGDQRITVEAFATVNIIGPLETVEVRSPTVSLETGQATRMRAVGYDANGREIPSLRLRWSVEDPQAGTIDGAGTFIAGTTPGGYENAIRVVATELDRL